MSDTNRERLEIQRLQREERRRRRNREAAIHLATRLEQLNELIIGYNNRGPISPNRNIQEREPSPERLFQENPFYERGESSSGPQSNRPRPTEPYPRVARLRPRSLNFWDDPDFDLTGIFPMAIPAARATIRLADFTPFAGLWDEDPDAHVQKFEVTCVANEIVDDDQKLHIFPATFKDEAASWYGNLAAADRATYGILRDNFLQKFRRQGFQDRLAQQLDYLLQGVNESIDHYIKRMETIARKMGVHVPNDDTQKRRFIDGLRDVNAQQFVGLRRPADLATAKQEACNWEEVQLSQQRRRELIHGPTGVAIPMGSTTRAGEPIPAYGVTPPQVVVNTNQTPYMLPNPCMTAPAYMLQTSTPQTPSINEEKVV
ncbi:hypothetical protein L7F22_053081 [Adiantum nelumboides]|nr:hypothetical protein [Adiantum nelumboides]